MKENTFSATEQMLGYIYQIRFALYQLFQLPENAVCFIEKDDDIDFTDQEEGKILFSLKHKAPGDSLSDLSPDFWKSVRIWLRAYISSNKVDEDLRFFLITTGTISTGSFLENFIPTKEKKVDIIKTIPELLESSRSKTIKKTKDELFILPTEEWFNFFKRITIFDNQERIQDIPNKIIGERLRSLRPQHRKSVFERLEGWWNNECILLLTGERKMPLSGNELSEKLAFISDQFHVDNLPIDYEFAEPKEKIEIEVDDRLFVRQLRSIGIHSERLRRAILDYYRAFEQRSSWLRENVTLSGELEEYDNRLVEEWARLKEIIFDEVDEEIQEELLQATGRKLLNELSTMTNPNLRIRTGVTATFVTMGSYHMLANEKEPSIYWHPCFKKRMDEILTGVQK